MNKTVRDMLRLYVRKGCITQTEYDEIVGKA